MSTEVNQVTQRMKGAAGVFSNLEKPRLPRAVAGAGGIGGAELVTLVTQLDPVEIMSTYEHYIAWSKVFHFVLFPRCPNI